MHVYTKKTTVRSLLNSLLRKPKKVSAIRLPSGLLVEEQIYKNKQILKVY